MNGEDPLCGGEALLRANATKRPMSTEQLLLLVELQVRELCGCCGPATRMLAPVVMPNTYWGKQVRLQEVEVHTLTVA